MPVLYATQGATFDLSGNFTGQIAFDPASSPFTFDHPTNVFSPGTPGTTGPAYNYLGTVEVSVPGTAEFVTLPVMETIELFPGGPTNLVVFNVTNFVLDFSTITVTPDPVDYTFYDGIYNYGLALTYNLITGTLVGNSPAGTLFDFDDDQQFEGGDVIPGIVAQSYQGTVMLGAVEAPAYASGVTLIVYVPVLSGIISVPGTTPPVDAGNPYVFCFAEGTRIAIPGGGCAVETLGIGDPVVTSDGRTVPVKWIGRQSVKKLFAGPRILPVRLRAGALGDGVPHTDLNVTADHGLIVDGLVINAAALVNHTTIDFVPRAELPAQFTFYHVETEAHDVIIANGAPAETFIDVAGRTAFDNYDEYLELYGVERIIPEMDRQRISSRRLLPAAIRSRLGIESAALDFSSVLSSRPERH